MFGSHDSENTEILETQNYDRNACVKQMIKKQRNSVNSGVLFVVMGKHRNPNKHGHIKINPHEREYN